MRFFLVALLMVVVVQPPQPVVITVEGFACKTPEHWIKYARAIAESDNNTIRNIRLSQRCVPAFLGEIEVLSDDGDFFLIEANARRRMYIPKWYTIQ